MGNYPKKFPRYNHVLLTHGGKFNPQKYRCRFLDGQNVCKMLRLGVSLFQVTPVNELKFNRNSNWNLTKAINYKKKRIFRAWQWHPKLRVIKKLTLSRDSVHVKKRSHTGNLHPSTRELSVVDVRSGTGCVSTDIRSIFIFNPRSFGADNNLEKRPAF